MTFNLSLFRRFHSSLEIEDETVETKTIDREREIEMMMRDSISTVFPLLQNI